MRTLLASMVILAVCGMASAAITVTAGTPTVGQGTAETFQILISTDAADKVTGTDLYVQIGTGQTGDITLVTCPLIADAETYADGDGWGSDYYGVVQFGELVSNPANDPVANGILATVTIDTSAVAVGTYDLVIASTVLGDSAMYQTSGSAVITFVDGDLEVTPEPATLSVLALGGLALLRRRR